MNQYPYPSTGPRTQAGKGRCKMNALTHGLQSEHGVVRGETVEGWESHLAGITAAVKPANAIEELLTVRVALLFWRLNRVTRFETGSILDEQINTVREDARFQRLNRMHRNPDTFLLDEDDSHDLEAAWKAAREGINVLADLPGMDPGTRVAANTVYHIFHALAPADDITPNLLKELGVPEPAVEEWVEWDGWTAGRLRQGMALLGGEDAATTGAKRLREDAVYYHALYRPVAEKERVAVETHTLPTQVDLDKIAKFEGHLRRQLRTALEQLATMRPDLNLAKIPTTPFRRTAG